MFNHALSNLTRWFVRISFLVVFMTVLIIDNRLANGFVSGKYFWFYLSTSLIAITAIIMAIKQKKRFQLGIMDGLILLYVCILAFSEDFATMETTQTKHML
ncbi:MAG: hypothetical protein LBV74_04000, partial [Tannerella sp.]|nr:hypothetical protein [Tannerella sp.]